MAKKKPAKKQVKKAAAKPAKKIAKKAAKKIAAKPIKKVLKPKKAAPPKKAATAKKTPPKAIGKVSIAKATRRDFSQFFTPIEDRVVVEFVAESDRTPGGLYIPQTVAERPSKGRVVAVGHGKVDKKGRRHAMDVQLGETVMFGTFAGSKMEIDGSEYLILRESDILGVVKE